MTNGSLIKVKSIAECSPWSILQYFWPGLSDNMSWKRICGLFESGCFTQVLLYILFFREYTPNMLITHSMVSAITIHCMLISTQWACGQILMMRATRLTIIKTTVLKQRFSSFTLCHKLWSSPVVTVCHKSNKFNYSLVYSLLQYIIGDGILLSWTGPCDISQRGQSSFYSMPQK